MKIQHLTDQQTPASKLALESPWPISSCFPYNVYIYWTPWEGLPFIIIDDIIFLSHKKDVWVFFLCSTQSRPDQNHSSLRNVQLLLESNPVASLKEHHTHSTAGFVWFTSRRHISHSEEIRKSCCTNSALLVRRGRKNMTFTVSFAFKETFSLTLKEWPVFFIKLLCTTCLSWALRMADICTRMR